MSECTSPSPNLLHVAFSQPLHPSPLLCPLLKSSNRRAPGAKNDRFIRLDSDAHTPELSSRAKVPVPCSRAHFYVAIPPPTTPAHTGPDRPKAGLDPQKSAIRFSANLFMAELLTEAGHIPGTPCDDMDTMISAEGCARMTKVRLRRAPARNLPPALHRRCEPPRGRFSSISGFT